MNNTVGLINASIQHGQSHKGVEQAPKFLKEFGVYQDLYSHFHSVKNYFIREDEQLCYGDLHKVTCSSLEQNDFSLILGGDHSLSLSTVPAVLKKHPDLKVIWIDAHADMNTPETSPSGNLHGMPLAAISGVFQAQKAFADFQWITEHIKPENIILLGTRDIDPGEKHLIQNYPYHVFSYEEVRESGISEVMRQVYNIVGDSPLHVSFDVDSINPLLAPATGVPVSDGLNLQDVVYIGQAMAKMHTVCLEMVEFNPLLASGKEGVQITAEAVMHFLRAFFRNYKYQRKTSEISMNF